MKRKASHGSPLLKLDDTADTTGVARVAFAQIGVVDHDGDYTEPGAFEVGQKVKVCQTGHAHGMRVAGAGTIVGEQDIDGKTWALADVKFFRETDAGEQEYLTAKALADAGHTQEWSYGYDTLEEAPGQMNGQAVNLLKRQSVYEISPVLRGAGIGTHTVGIKSADGTCSECGQALPKQLDEAVTDTTEIVVDDDLEAAQAAKSRINDALVRFEVDRALRLGVLIDTD